MSFIKDTTPKRLIYLFSFGLLIRLVLAWLPEKYFFYLVSDDAYYYFSVARNLATRGMLSADGITLTNGFHPLWLFMMTPIYLLFGASNPWLSIHVTITLAAFFDMAAAFLIYKVLERLGKPNVGFWAAAFYTVTPYGLLHTMNGLETAQNNFFLALLVYLSVKADLEWLKTNWFFLGCVCGLTLLSRTDNIFVVSVFLAFLLWRNRNLALITKTVAISSLIVSPWLLYNLLTFGTIFQTSGAAYPYIHHQQFLKEHGTYLSSNIFSHILKLGFYSFTDNAFHYGSWILTIAIGVILVLRLRKWPQKYRPLLWTLAAAMLFICFHIFIRWSVRLWYAQAVFVLTLPVIALTCERLNKKMLWVGTLVTLLLSGSWSVANPFRVADRSKVMLNLVQKKIPQDDKVGIFNSGFTQYFTDQRVFNLDGLVNNEILEYYKKRNGMQYFRERKIRWLLDTQGYLFDFFEPYFGEGSDSLLAVADYYTDISVPGNNVFLIEVSADGIHPPLDTLTTFGEVEKIYHVKATQRRVIPIPFVNYFRLF